LNLYNKNIYMYIHLFYFYNLTVAISVGKKYKLLLNINYLLESKNYFYKVVNVDQN
jgi:hypothetical protein